MVSVASMLLLEQSAGLLFTVGWEEEEEEDACVGDIFILRDHSDCMEYK